MATKFLSKEYETVLREKLMEEFSKPSNLTCTFCQIIHGCPDGKDRYMIYGVDKGVANLFEIGEGEPPAADYRVHGPYQVYADLVKGKQDGKVALVTKKLQLEGSMIKALGLIGAYIRIEKTQRAVDTEV